MLMQLELFLDLTNKKKPFSIFGSTEGSWVFENQNKNSVSKEMLVLTKLLKGINSAQKFS